MLLDPMSDEAECCFALEKKVNCFVNGSNLASQCKVIKRESLQRKRENKEKNKIFEQ